jgi:hypothetical protein
MATLQSVNSMVDSCTEVVQSVVGDLYEQFLCLRSSPTEEAWNSLDSKFKDSLDPFVGLRTLYQQTEYVKKLHAFIPPVEYAISSIVNRNPVYVNHHKAQFKMPQLQKVTGQFVPIREMILALNAHTDIIKNCIIRLELQAETQADGVLRSFFDGLYWRNHPLFGQKVIVLRLYGDDFEPSNPLGSHRCIYKIGCLYYQFENLQQRLQSRIDNIFMALCYHSDDVKAFG